MTGGHRVAGGHRVTGVHRVAEEAAETGRLLEASDVRKVLGVEGAALLMVLHHPKMTALFKPRKKGPAPSPCVP